MNTEYLLGLVVFIAAVFNLLFELRFWSPFIKDFYDEIELKYPEIELSSNFIFLVFPIMACFLISPWYLILYIIDAVHASNKLLWEKSKIYKHIDIAFFITMYLIAIIYCLEFTL